jgi:cell division protease FtsH
MDGFEANQAVIVLAATNRPDVLDPALVRPGRFDRQVVVERPQKAGREAILKVHTRRIPLADDVDLETVARATIGFSGADLQNLANEAALLAAREGHHVVRMSDFERAKDKILLGTLRDESLSEKERKVTAYHEAGHAMLALLLPEADPVHAVTIVPRGRALGVTQMLPQEDASSATRTYLQSQVAILLGGRAAEELIFEEVTTGAENDLDRATDLVEKMICRWGMSEKLGPVAFRRGAEHVFLGRELGEHKSFSEHTAMLIDDEIRHMLDVAYSRARSLLESEKGRLVKLAEQLLEREELTDVEMYELLDLPKPASVLERENQAAARRSTPKPGGAPSESAAEDIDPDLLGLEGA